MSADFLKKIAEAEMAAYDALPSELRKVFADAPRNVSVTYTMNLPGVKKAYKSMPLADFCEVLKTHLAAQAGDEAAVST